MRRSSWQGEFSDGETASLHAVRVDYAGDSLRILDEAGLELKRWEVRLIETDPGGADDVLVLYSRDDRGPLLALRGDEIRDDLEAIGIRTRSIPTGVARRTIAGLGLMAGIVGVAGLLWLGATPLSRLIAGLVPIEYERALASRIEQAFSEYHCEGDAAAVVLEELVVRLAGEDHRLPQVHVLNLDLPNAFALPGGGIVFTRGLLESAETPDEVAGVLAHEIQHVEQRHVMTGMVRAALLSSAWAVTVGDYAGLLIIDPTTAFEIATMKFSRDDEASADRGAVEMLKRAGMRSDGLSRFFGRLAEEGGDPPEWLSTHPASGRRAVAATSDGDGRGDLAPALDAESWAILVDACAETDAPEMDLTDLFL